MEIYVVTADGWREEYGSRTYLIGVFDSEKLAKAACIDKYYCITKVNLNTQYPLSKVKWSYDEEYSNVNFLGGYVE